MYSIKFKENMQFFYFFIISKYSQPLIQRTNAEGILSVSVKSLLLG